MKGCLNETNWCWVLMAGSTLDLVSTHQKTQTHYVLGLMSLSLKLLSVILVD